MLDLDLCLMTLSVNFKNRLIIIFLMCSLSIISLSKYLCVGKGNPNNDLINLCHMLHKGIVSFEYMSHINSRTGAVGISLLISYIPAGLASQILV